METISGFMLLTFWLCAGVNYIMLRNMSKRQKGLLLGVTCPRRQTPCRGAGHCKTISNAAGHPLSGLRRAQCAAGLCAGDRHRADTLDALLFCRLALPYLPCCGPTQSSMH